MNNKMLRTLLLLVLAALAGSTAHAQTTTTPTCILGYTIGFFNGVANTELDALITLNQVKGSIEEVTGNSDDTYNHEDIQYQVFYNTTGSTVGSTAIQDLAETFMQRQQQLDPSGFFSTNNLYMMWEEINGGGSGNYLAYAGNAPLPSNAISTLTSATVTSLVSQLATLYSPPTGYNYATQNAQLDQVAASGRKLLLVAHSQGNLFVDQGYDHIQPVVGSTRVKVVHVAPASPTLRGQWILSYNDLIINGLRALGGISTVPANNIGIAIASYENTGHSMGPTYLDTTPGRTNGRMQVENLELAGLQALTAPPGCAVKVTPANASLSPGSAQTLTASLNPAPTDSVLQTEYFWTVTGNAGGTLPGGVTTLSTETPTVNYTVPKTALTGQTDTVTVKVMASKMAGDQVNAVPLGNGSATLTVAQLQVAISPATANINTGKSTTLTATVTGAANPPGSYLWSTTGKYGLLSGQGLSGVVSGQYQLCSTGPVVTYTAGTDESLSNGTVYSDSATVQVFSDANCGKLSGSAALATANAVINVTEVKNLSAWLGYWGICTEPFNPGLSDYMNIKQTPPGTNADLLYTIQNRSNLAQSGSSIEVDPTDNTRGYDNTYASSYADAISKGLTVYSNTGGVFTIARQGTVYESCTR